MMKTQVKNQHLLLYLKAFVIFLKSRIKKPAPKQDFQGFQILSPQTVLQGLKLKQKAR